MRQVVLPNFCTTHCRCNRPATPFLLQALLHLFIVGIECRAFWNCSWNKYHRSQQRHHVGGTQRCIIGTCSNAGAPCRWNGAERRRSGAGAERRTCAQRRTNAARRCRTTVNTATHRAGRPARCTTVERRCIYGTFNGTTTVQRCRWCANAR